LMSYFKRIKQIDLLPRISKREGETKLGENLKLGLDGERYVLLGVPESIGVRANCGKQGTESLWSAFLDAFLNIQSTQKLYGNELSILGYFDFSPLVPDPEAPLQRWRKAVSVIDQAVSEVVQGIVDNGKVPIVIGGGHNNCYPIIKGVAKGLYVQRKLAVPQLNVVNFDAHADFRAMEGRHSGNGFRYAYAEKYLRKYAVLGLSENYNSQNMLEDLKASPDVDLVFWEDVFLSKKLTFEDALLRALNFMDEQFFGVELDMDAIENSLSSAVSPVGFSANQARQFVYNLGVNKKAAYLHICEGAVKMASGEEDKVNGKLVSFLVSDFIKANLIGGK